VRHEEGTHIKAECFTPWRSASAFEVLIFLLLILAAHRFLQFRRASDEPSGAAPSVPDSEASTSDSEALTDSMGMLPVGLVGRGEKVPW
jgi:hypothetical protein